MISLDDITSAINRAHCHMEDYAIENGAANAGDRPEIDSIFCQLEEIEGKIRDLEAGPDDDRDPPEATK